MEQRILNYKKYLILKDYSQETIRSYFGIVKLYLKHIEQYPKNKIKDYIEVLKDRRLKHSTINSYIRGINAYYRYREEILEEKSNHIPLLSLAKENRVVGILSRGEIEILFTGCQNKREELVLIGLYDLGLRVSELSNLKEEDVYLEENFILITKSKTGYQRKIPLSIRAKNSIEEHLEGNEYLLSKNGRKIEVQNLRRILKRQVKRMNITTHIYPHLLRHSIASHLLENGMPIERLSQFLGHRSLDATQIYTHLK